MRLSESEYDALLARGTVWPLEGTRRREAAVPAISEKAFQSAIVREATRAGWLVFHPYSAKRSTPGFFDVSLAKAGHPLVLAELKTASGIVLLAQQRWFDTVKQATGVESYLWRPEDWPQIVALLHASQHP